MKRKIALLLAVTMILSILPMSVAASTAVTGAGHATGQLWGGEQPANDVRHWGDGVLVGNNVSGMTGVSGTHPGLGSWGNTARTFSGTNGVGVRNIAASLDYFNAPNVVNTASATAIRVEIHNVRAWLSRVNGFAWPNAAAAWADVYQVAGFSSQVGLIHYLRSEGAGVTANVPDNVSPGVTDPNVMLPGANTYRFRPMFSERGVNADGVEFGVALVPVSERVAWLIMSRSAVGHTSSANNISIPVPMQYLTNGDTNDYEVYVRFQPQARFAAVGGSGQRTVLTTTAPTRFNFTRQGDIRHFHRFGRGEIEAIRIAEGALGAFNATDWIVQLDIQTPGFFWTAGSVENMGFRPQIAGGIRSVERLAPAVRGHQGRATDRFNRITFPVRLHGVMEEGRNVLTWYEITGLSISADDRARDGDVEVEVRMWHAVHGAGTATTSWGWRWEATGEQGVNLAAPWHLNWTNPVTGTSYNRIDQHIITSSTPAIRIYGRFRTNAAGQPIGNTFVANSLRAVTGFDPVAPSGYVYIHMGTLSPDPRQADGVAGNWGRIGDAVYGTITAARFGRIGLELELYANHDLEDFWLRSGMQDWDILTGLDYRGRTLPLGAVDGPSVVPDYHRTARLELREIVPGSLPGTGAHPTTFTFNEGIQVLGVRFWTNNAHFSQGENDTDGRVWFGNHFEADNFLSTTISRNAVTIRPEIGQDIERRWRTARIRAEFYLSIQPGFEALYGEDLDVTVTSGTIYEPFEDTLTIAYVWDPISVSMTPMADIDPAAFGLVRGVPLNDVTITEVRAGVLEPGTRLWIGVEGGISRSWGSADHLSLAAARVTTTDPHMTLSLPRIDSHGTFVEIIRPSRYDGAEIVFSGIEMSGRVIPNQTYNIFVAEDAVAANWEGFTWMRENLLGRFTRGTLHGWFHQEPYPTEAFSFEGDDFYAPPPPVVQQPPVLPTGPVTFHLNSSHVTRDGDVVAAPVFVLVPNITNPNYVTSYVAVRAVADLAGFPWGPGASGWDPATQTATFTDGTTTLVFTANSTSATINGVPTPITAGGLGADARIINDRMFIPISFFNTLPVPISVVWNPYVNVAQRSITIFPAPPAAAVPATAPTAPPTPPPTQPPANDYNDYNDNGYNDYDDDEDAE